MAPFNQGSGTTLENLSFKAGGEALNDPKPAVLSCGGMHLPHHHVPGGRPLKWRDILAIPGAEMAQRLFGLEPVVYAWNPYLEEAIYEN